MITVKDLEESVKFYTEILGLSVEKRFNPMEGIAIAFLIDKNKNKIELIQNDIEKNNFDKSVKSSVSIAFEAENLDDSVVLLKNKQVEIKKGPFPLGTGRALIIEDPNGIVLGLYENV